MSKWNVMKTKPLHEKNVYYTYHGYRFIAEWNEADKIYHNEIKYYFNQYDFVSFHKLFPRLDEMFTDTARGTAVLGADWHGRADEVQKHFEKAWQFADVELTSAVL